MSSCSEYLNRYWVDTRKSCIYLFIRRRRIFFRNIYLFTQIFIILLNVFIYLLAVGDEKYKVSIYLLNVFVGFERMFFPVRKQKKKSQSNKCKILKWKYFRTSRSTQEYLSTQTCQVQNTQEYLSTQTCEVQNTQEYLSTKKCQVQNTQEYLSTQTSKYPNTHQYLSTQKYLWQNTQYLLTWNISLSNRVWYIL